MKRLVATEMLLGALVFGAGKDRNEHREPVSFGSTVCLELAVHLSPAMHAGEVPVSAIRSVMLLSCASARLGEKEFPIGWNSRQAGYAAIILVHALACGPGYWERNVISPVYLVWSAANEGRILWLERAFCLRLLLDAVMASTVHQRFASRLPSLEQEMGEELFVSGLVGPYRIFQRKNGHRHGIDDATTAWYALQKTPPVKKTLDLGAGIGTVGLAVLWGLGAGTELTCVEAQEISYRLLTENIQGNGLNECVRAIHGDIRDLDLGERFPLITGSPPYFPIGTGSLPEDSQKAHARFEFRGDIGDYARAANRHITDDGLFVFCFPFQQKSRCIKLVTDVGFRLITIRDVVPMKSKPALFSLFCASLSFTGALTEENPLIVAFEDGKYTLEMRALQATRGFGPEGTNVIY